MSYIKEQFIKQELTNRRNKHQFRVLKDIFPLDATQVICDGRQMINFSSNDYLGLAFHPLLKERSIEYIEKFGNGSTASRLVCGNLSCFGEVEARLAALKGSENSLILNSGYQANVSFIPALTDRHSLIVADKLAHNSLIQGGLLSRGKLVRFRHNDMEHLGQILKNADRKKYPRIIIVSESVFSMDGDLCDINILSDYAKKYDAFLVIDEAHATGVFGDNGMGRACRRDVDIIMGTFGKACGSFGAYIASSTEIKDYLINCCPGLIYSTALPPSVIGAIDAALELVPEMATERHQLLAMAEYFRNAIREHGFDTGNSASQIVPIIVGEDDKALELSAWLAENNMLVSAIRPPTVEKGKARVRVTISALHEKDQIDQLIDALAKWKLHG